MSDRGEQAGFDLAEVAQVGVVGRWSGMPVDLIVRRLELVEPTPGILAARAELRQRLAQQASQQQKAAEEAEKRKQTLLDGGAPHPVDGPEVRLVGTVAPDILALRLQEREFVPVPQVPYEPREGDVVKREGKEEEKVLAMEDGEVRESLLQVTVYRREGSREVKLGSLAVNAKAIKPDDRATGQFLTAETVGETGAYRIVGVNDPDWPGPVLPAQVWWKRKPNATGSVAFEVQVFLKLPKPMQEGKRYRLAFPGVNLRHWDRHIGHTGAMWVLVDLYELFPERIGGIKLALPEAEAGNAIPDILDEVLWDLDLYRRLQTPTGGISGGIESTSHPRPGEASWQESLMLSAYAPDPMASFTYAATAAKLARALAASDGKLARTYASSARKAWDWAVGNQEPFLGGLDAEKRTALAARRCNELNLAAFELWRLTGEADFHDAFRSTFILAGAKGDVNTQAKAITSYARLPEAQGDEALRQTARQWVIEAADRGLAFADGNAFGLTLWVPTLPPMGWIGYFSTPETALGAMLPHAWLLTRDPKYLAGALRATQFGAGANPDNRAYTSGLGPDPVRFPLHVDSGVSGQPAPVGITVYGGSDPAENFDFDNWAYTWFLQKMAPSPRTWPAYEGSYWDIHVVPSTNEYTIQQTIIPTAFYWGFLAARR